MTIVSANLLSKHYRLYGKPSDRLRELITRKPCHQLKESLSDVTFSLQAGESLGIIGDNGAGKSTLLKMLAGTLTPSSGTYEVSGRVAALLELGAAFHPEFTGRQNIHLNASLLGLSDAEIAQKEPDIIEFAEIGAYIDQPIRTYSSGMLVRLGFSIATSVSPDILVVDEALSVGDLHFQRKCIQRIRKFIERGVTLLFCSHNLYQLQELCDKSLWIHQGRQVAFGDSRVVVARYREFCERREGTPGLQPEAVMGESESPSGAETETDTPEIASSETEDAQTNEDQHQTNNCHVVISSVVVKDGQGNPVNSFSPMSSFRIDIDVKNAGRDPLPVHLGVVFRQMDKIVYVGSSKIAGCEPYLLQGATTIEFQIPRLMINSGRFEVRVLVGDESAMVGYAEASAGEVEVVSSWPDFGLLAMESQWKFPS